jgi:hypothetical protein
VSIFIDRQLLEQGDPSVVVALLLDHIGEQVSIVDGSARPNVVTRNGFGPFDPDELVPVGVFIRPEWFRAHADAAVDRLREGPAYDRIIGALDERG